MLNLLSRLSVLQTIPLIYSSVPSTHIFLNLNERKKIEDSAAFGSSNCIKHQSVTLCDSVCWHNAAVNTDSTVAVRWKAFLREYYSPIIWLPSTVTHDIITIGLLL